MPVSQRRELRILLAAHAREVSHKFLIELLALRPQGVEITLRPSQQISRLCAIAPPVGTQALVKILDGIKVVVSQDQVPGHGLHADLAEVKRQRHQRRAANAGGNRRAGNLVAGQTSMLQKRLVAGGCIGDGAGGHGGSGRSHIKVAPVDAKVIAGFGQYRLRLAPRPQRGKAARVFARPDDILIVGVHHQLRAVGVEDVDGVRAAVYRTSFPNQVGDGP